MPYFLQTLSETIKENPQRLAFKSSINKKGITNGQLEEYSGRVYNYLKSHNIGKEDFVLICLPRGVRPFVSMIGIWKAGAALIIVESSYPKERIEYIIKDVNAKLVIDEKVYAEMMESDYLEGYKQADRHDACFAIYTSGSTGNPKGVLHEYGKLEILVSNKLDPVFDNGLRLFANIAPLNFIASIGYCFYLYMHEFTIHIIDYDIAKNPLKMVNYIEDNGITGFFGTPSYLKILPYIPRCLKLIYTAGEIVSELYLEGVKVKNTYSCSEAGISISQFVIDKKYANTPVGKNPYHNEIFLLDDDGKPINKGEKGEICFKNDFTRGYINLPLKTKEVFIDGIYHTGDLGCFNENDDLIVLGRKDEMIKISGNRVEPVEIESTLKKVLGLNVCLVKGFNENSKSYLVAYFLSKELKTYDLLDETNEFKLSINEMNDKLANVLPYYMFPSIYMVIDEIPKNANGKIYKKALPNPLEKVESKTFVRPETEEEKYFCQLFENILKVNSVGIDDDFYQIGGDSLEAMNLVTTVNNPEISITDIYKERTPRNLAKLLVSKKSLDFGSIDERNIKALEHSQLLFGDSEYAIVNQLTNPDSTMWNLSFCYRLKDDVDLKRLQKAIDRVLKAHPAFCTHFFYDNDVLKMKYDLSYFQETSIFELSQTEFENLKSKLVKPFKVIETALYRNAIYKTEIANYLFLDIHHSISDGTSLGILFKQIFKAYQNENYIIETDYFYLINRNLMKNMKSPKIIEGKNIYQKEVKNLYAKDFASLVLKPDFNLTESSFKQAELYDALTIKDLVKQSQITTKYGENVFFLACFLKAIAEYNQHDTVYSMFVHNGRDEMIKMNANGLLFHTYPVFIDFSKTKSDTEILDAVKERVQQEIGKANPFFVESCSEYLDTVPYFIYQNNIYKLNNAEMFAENIDLSTQKNNLDSYIALQIIDNDDSDKYIIHFEYVSDIYKKEAMEKFIELYKNIANDLIKTK